MVDLEGYILRKRNGCHIKLEIVLGFLSTLRLQDSLEHIWINIIREILQELLILINIFVE